MIDYGLKDKVVLITGANNPLGIGAAAARAFAAQGARIFVTYKRAEPAREFAADELSQPGEALYTRNNAQDASAVLREIRQVGGEAEAMEVDLSDPNAIIPVFDRIEAVFGPVDVLVNNAAYSDTTTFLPAEQPLANTFSVAWRQTPTLTAEDHDRHFAVNSRAVALMMVEYARRHVARGATWGRIVNISTDSADGFPSEISYGASKNALESYSRAAASELGRFGITVNIVSPGPTQTGWLPPDMESVIAEHSPLKRIGQPEDVADVILFLASDQARWLTGQCIRAGGGHRM
jgi:3-oxoacyl-[acyl-carrier protein] reductase